MPTQPRSLRRVGETAYHLNLEAPVESGFERETLEGVVSAMDELMRTPTSVDGAVMPDACPTGPASIPVGGVVVAENAIHPGFHSADICCSVMATDLGADVEPRAVLDVAARVTHFGRGGRKRSAGVFKHLGRDLRDRIAAHPLLEKADLKRAELHLGTQGDGNHVLFVGRRESDDAVMLVTHHGSRGFGAGLYERGMQIAERFRAENCPEVDPQNAWIPFGTEEGRQYWDALQIVRDWTKRNHEVIHGMVAERCGVPSFEGVSAGGATFWNEHNFVFRTERDGVDLFHHAKGATPLDDSFLPDSFDGLRLIPLNMGEPILVVRGGTGPTNLGFAPHGAGRNTSRTKHKQQRRSRGATDEAILEEETRGLDVRFHTSRPDISELPSAYKDAAEIQRQMEKFGLGEVVDRIRPYGCIMAGERRPSGAAGCITPDGTLDGVRPAEP